MIAGSGKAGAVAGGWSGRAGPFSRDDGGAGAGGRALAGVGGFRRARTGVGPAWAGDDRRGSPFLDGASSRPPIGRRGL